MKSLLVYVLVLAILFVPFTALMGCKGPALTQEDEATVLQIIDEKVASGEITEDIAERLRQVLFNIQNPVNLGEVAMALGTIAMGYFGLRFQQKRDLAKRERTVSDPQDAALLMQLLAEKKAVMAKEGKALPPVDTKP